MTTHDILTTPAPSVRPIVREYTEQQTQLIEELRAVSFSLKHDAVGRTDSHLSLLFVLGLCTSFLYFYQIWSTVL